MCPFLGYTSRKGGSFVSQHSWQFKTQLRTREVRLKVTRTYCSRIEGLATVLVSV